VPSDAASIPSRSKYETSNVDAVVPSGAVGVVSSDAEGTLDAWGTEPVMVY